MIVRDAPETWGATDGARPGAPPAILAMHGDEHFSQEQKHEAAVGLLADVIFMSRADAFVGDALALYERLDGAR